MILNGIGILTRNYLKQASYIPAILPVSLLVPKCGRKKLYFLDTEIIS